MINLKKGKHSGKRLETEPVEPIIEITDLRFSWKHGSEPVLDLDEFLVNPGEQVFVMGPSGSGKSTLLSLLTGIITPGAGEVKVLHNRLSAMNGTARDRFRADYIGYIFQMFNLIPYLSIIENVLLPCRFSRLRKEKAVRNGSTLEQEAVRLLKRLHLSGETLLNKSVVELSVGQQQRVAAARALIGSPELVIADEPTSSLDAAHRESFIRLLFDECRATGATVVFVSHDMGLAPLFSRIIALPEINRAFRPDPDFTGGVS